VISDLADKPLAGQFIEHVYGNLDFGEAGFQT